MQCRLDMSEKSLNLCPRTYAHRQVRGIFLYWCWSSIELLTSVYYIYAFSICPSGSIAGHLHPRAVSMHSFIEMFTALMDCTLKWKLIRNSIYNDEWNKYKIYCHFLSFSQKYIIYIVYYILYKDFCFSSLFILLENRRFVYLLQLEWVGL